MNVIKRDVIREIEGIIESCNLEVSEDVIKCFHSVNAIRRFWSSVSGEALSFISMKTEILEKYTELLDVYLEL